MHVRSLSELRLRHSFFRVANIFPVLCPLSLSYQRASVLGEDIHPEDASEPPVPHNLHDDIRALLKGSFSLFGSSLAAFLKVFHTGPHFRLLQH